MSQLVQQEAAEKLYLDHVRVGRTLEAEFAPHKIAHHRFFSLFFARQAALAALEDHAEGRLGSWAVQHTTIMSQLLLNNSIAVHSNTKDPTRRLKVAYVSPDLNGTHAGINYNFGEMLFCRFP